MGEGEGDMGWPEMTARGRKRRYSSSKGLVFMKVYLAALVYAHNRIKHCIHRS